MTGAGAMLSVFIREPEFQGQTKDRLATAERKRLSSRRSKTRSTIGSPAIRRRPTSCSIRGRARRRAASPPRGEGDRAQGAVRKLRLPGKLADCTNTAAEGSELFVVEGDSAGGSAKQARDRDPGDPAAARQDPQRRLGRQGQARAEPAARRSDPGARLRHRRALSRRGFALRRIIIMTDADVDGAHIASLLITFFYREMPRLIDNGHLYLAVPPLYRLSHGGKIFYARDDKHHKDALMKKEFHANAKVEVSRFKGLGEMMAAQLKETTMDPKKRTLLRVVLLEDERKIPKNRSSG
jgi:topoisomerase-4 subunit B